MYYFEDLDEIKGFKHRIVVDLFQSEWNGGICKNIYANWLLTYLLSYQFIVLDLPRKSSQKI